MARQVRRAGRSAEPSFEPYYGAIGRRTSNRRRWLWLIGLVVAVVVAAKAFAVHSVTVQGVGNQTGITDTVRSNLNRHLLWSNLLFLPSQGLAAIITQSHQQEIAEVSVRKQWFSHGIVISAQPRQHSLAWQSRGQRYGLDQTGRITDRLNAKTERPVIVDTSNVRVLPNDQVVSRQFVSFMLDMVNQLSGRLAIKTSGARIGKTTNEVAILTKRGFYIRVDTGRGVSEQIDELAAVLEAAKRKHRLPQQYVDVRIPYKAYYR